MTLKYFPIKSDTACQLKWNWSTLYLTGGKTASCHRTGWSDLTVENFDSFHNTDKKQEERRQMLQGQWPSDSCDYCQKIESLGGFSDRMLQLDVPNMSPPELEIDPTAVKVSPVILEVFFNNTCNLSCIYCLPELSSKLNQEYLKFGDFKSEGVNLISIDKNNDYEKLLDKFWTWMQNNSHTLQRFNILGGEAFYQEEFYKLLEYMEQHPHPNLELGIVTNLMIDTDKLKKITDRFKVLLSRRHLKRIDLTCSIDCAGEPQEYVRYGLDLALWEKNFEFLIKYKWLKLNINQTISVLTIKTMPELLEKIARWRQQHKIEHSFSAITPQPTYLMPHILGNKTFKDDFEKIISLMPTVTQQDKLTVSYMEGIKNQICSAEPNPVEKRKLKIFLDEKDRRRGTNWKNTFPWLIKELNDVV
jgi:organic radical activating enzyme